MKGSSVATIVGVVVIVLIVGLFAFRETEAPTVTPDPSPVFEDMTETNAETAVQDNRVDEFSVEEGASDEDVLAESDSAVSEEVVISIDESGFTPSNVTISAGTTVTFVNNGQAAHWPASDVHPTHEILPEFDSGRGLATGETYSYTFTEVGVWNMHDHLVPRNVGTIVVE